MQFILIFQWKYTVSVYLKVFKHSTRLLYDNLFRSEMIELKLEAIKVWSQKRCTTLINQSTASTLGSQFFSKNQNQRKSVMIFVTMYCILIYFHFCADNIGLINVYIQLVTIFSIGDVM